MSQVTVSQISAEERDAELVVARSLKRVEEKKARADQAKKRKRTPAHKRMHHVDNDVHMQNESARQVDQRDEIDRENELPTSWRRPSALGAPEPRPGYVQRWVRFRMGNQEDVDNLEKMMEQGWRPRKRTAAKRGHELTAGSDAKYGQYYVKRGLILMEMPETLADQRDKFYRNRLKRMTESIDRNLFKENNRVMPLLQPFRKTVTTTTARRGRLDDHVPGDDEAEE